MIDIDKSPNRFGQTLVEVSFWIDENTSVQDLFNLVTEMKNNVPQPSEEFIYYVKVERNIKLITEYIRDSTLEEIEEHKQIIDNAERNERHQYEILKAKYEGK